MTIENTIIIRASSRMIKKLTTGKKTDARMAPKETYLEIKNTSKKIHKQITAVSRFIAKIIPKVVATPFPPLKLAKTGNTCPIIAQNDAINCRIKTSSLKPM